jgi:LacI family transcriptional regulator
MPSPPRRVALMLDLQWSYKRHAQIFAGIQRYAEERNWTTVIDEFVHYRLNPRSKSGKPYDGIVARANQQLAIRAAKIGIPVVNVWFSSPVRRRLPGVFHDATATGRMVAEHLLARGFRNFATITSPQNVSNELQVKEFSRLVKEAGFSVTSTYVPQHPHRDISHWRRTEKMIVQAMEQWKPPIGVYSATELHGRMVIQVAQQRGWRIPQDAAIVAGQNEETLCERPRPSMTSVELGFDRIGYAAAELLDRLMDGELPPARPTLLPPQGMVVRESTDFFATDNDVVAAALAFISANCHRPINVGDVAQAVGTETRTLQNYFRDAIDRPIATEIRRVRIERAKRDLVQNDRPIAAIAREAGFGNMQRMYEVFRRELGISPSEYRKQRNLELAANALRGRDGDASMH